MPPRPDGPLGSLEGRALSRLQALADIRCPRCSSLIAATDLDLQRRLATCRGCDVRFDYYRPEWQAPPKPSTPIAKPRGISIHREEPDVDILAPRGAAPPKGRLILVRRWFTWESLFLLGFAIVWNAIIGLVWLLGSAPLVPRILFAIFGVAIAYVALSFLVIRTKITLDSRRLTVTQGPLPWPGKSELASSNIDQVYCVRETGGTRKQRPSFAISARLKNGDSVRLLSAFDSLEQARFLEQEIESYYEIADRQVHGEYRSGKP